MTSVVCLLAYNIRVLLFREDCLRGGEGGLENVLPRVVSLEEFEFVDCAFIFLIFELCPDVCLYREDTGVAEEVVFRCTRIRVNVGEIGKYSTPESSVDKVFRIVCWSRVREELRAVVPCHQKVSRKVSFQKLVIPPWFFLIRYSVKFEKSSRQ